MYSINDRINLRKHLTFIWRQKINFILPSVIFLLLRYCELALGTLGMAIHTKSDTINIWKTFAFIRRQKFNFMLHAFLKINCQHLGL